MKTPEIIPAIMPASFADLLDMAALVHADVKTIQIDIMDGQYVPGVTWPFNWGGTPFSTIEEEGLPFLSDVDYEIDMMVAKPAATAAAWAKAGAKRLIVHAGSIQLDPEALAELRIGEVEVGLALGSETSVDAAAELIPLVDVVQFMGIKEIGKQGEPFDDSVLGKIRALKDAFPDTLVSVDGGVNLKTVPQLKALGVDRLVAGSAIFASENPSDAIEALARA